MLYTASYFESRHWHGDLIAISPSVPKEIKVKASLPFLFPSVELLSAWRAKQIDEVEYTERYRAQIKDSWSQVKKWLDSLKPEKDLTLVCWERKGEWCHRNLLAKLAKSYRPDCFRGCDVVRIEMPVCDRCGSSSTIPGLERNYCRTCKTWFSEKSGNT